MINKSPQNRDIDYERLSKLEDSIRDLQNRMDKEIPPNLHEKLLNIDPKFENMELKFGNKIDSLNQDLVNVKELMKERLIFMSILVALITALVTKYVILR